MQTPLATTTPAYSGFIKGWLWYDLMLSVVRGLLAVATLVAIGELADDAIERTAGWVELCLGIGVAVFGIAGNILLLRQRRLGVFLAGLSLAFVGLGMIASYGLMAYLLAHPDEASCPPDALIGGVVIGTLMRGMTNVVTLVVVKQAARSLRHVDVERSA